MHRSTSCWRLIVAEQNDEANGTGDANDDNYDKSLLDAANADDMSGFAAPTGPAEEIFHVTELINSANDVGDGHPEENDNDEMEFEESQGEEDEEGGDTLTRTTGLRRGTRSPRIAVRKILTVDTTAAAVTAVSAKGTVEV